MSLKKYALSMGDKMAAGALGAQGIMGEAAPPRPNLLDVPLKSLYEIVYKPMWDNRLQ